MKKQIFIDTSALVALADTKDQDYAKVYGFFTNKYHPETMSLITTDFVLDEFLTILRCRERQPMDKLTKFMKAFFVSDIELVGIGKDLFGDALTLMATFDDQDFSCTDCVSFMVMKDLKIKDVITLDKHFTIAGFNNILNYL